MPESLPKPLRRIEDAEIRIGVSTCLLGEQVRYDAGHKHDRYVTDVLGAYFRFVPVCPEVETGMGIPREPVLLVRQSGEVRMVGVASRTDHTDAMKAFARRRVRELKALGLSGYILKKGSPSCGMERVKVYAASGMPSTSSRGLFADALLEALPLLPVEEEGRLCDARLRENFVERVFAHRRVHDSFAPRWRLGDLVAFHTREKMLLCAHAPAAEKELGRLVANARSRTRAEVEEGYKTGFMQALARPATVAKHVNVLQHVLGHFRGRLEPAARKAMAEVIEDYRRELVPLIVPVTLVRHYVALYDLPYLASQTYLEPHPKELMLRNHA